jgi:RimJ/RimL family protein N-acetyltransferase
MGMVQWAGPVFNWPLTQKQFRTHLETTHSEPPTLYSFGLYQNLSIIGYCELSNHNRNSNSAIISRVQIAPCNRNNGFGQLMIRKLLEFGFNKLNLNRIGLAVFDFNAPAIRCYEKTGFCIEGTLRETSKVDTTYWNCHIMSILKREWHASSS